MAHLSFLSTIYPPRLNHVTESWPQSVDYQPAVQIRVEDGYHVSLMVAYGRASYGESPVRYRDAGRARARYPDDGAIAQSLILARGPKKGEAMKVHIISDMEGVSGIVKWEQVTGGHAMYEEGRRLYTEEINAAIRGARAAGATEIVVMDCHGAGGPWSFNSMVPELLDPTCEYVVQGEWTEYTAFLEQGCDAALFVGMHARAGTQNGVMNHTVSGQAWQNLWFNGKLVGETGINAALCGTWGCPVVLVTGDDVTCREAEDLLGSGLTTVAVKQGLGRFSARQIPPVRARRMIEEGARAALRDLRAVAAYNPGKPCEIVVEFTRTEAFDEYRRRPGLEVSGDRRLTVRAGDWWTAWRQFFC